MADHNELMTTGFTTINELIYSFKTTDHEQPPKVLIDYDVGIDENLSDLVFAAPALYQQLALNTTIMDCVIEQYEALNVIMPKSAKILEDALLGLYKVRNGNMTVMRLATDGYAKVANSVMAEHKIKLK